MHIRSMAVVTAFLFGVATCYYSLAWLTWLWALPILLKPNYTYYDLVLSHITWFLVWLAEIHCIITAVRRYRQPHHAVRF